MNKAIQIRFLFAEMYGQCKEYLMLETDSGPDERTSALKEEIMRQYSEISSLIKIRSDLSESRKEMMC
jgi:hypothetical protein